MANQVVSLILFVSIICATTNCCFGQVFLPPPGGRCGDAPRVIGAVSVTFNANESSIPGLAFAFYTCEGGDKTAPTMIIFCLANNTWQTPPRCPGVALGKVRQGSVAYLVAPAVLRHEYHPRRFNLPPPQQHPCSNNDEITAYDCKPVITYRYSPLLGKCRAIASCPDSPIGIAANNFVTKENCTRRCFAIGATTVTTTTTSTQTPLPVPNPEPAEPQSADYSDPQIKTGGTRGPSCIEGVDPHYHSSCLGNSPFLLNTIRFEVAHALDPQNLWRKFVSPPATKMFDLQWHQGLAITAERWAAQCNEFSEDNSKRRSLSGFGFIGQNMCFSSGRQKTWKECINEWVAQRSKWSYGVGSQTGNTADVKNYVQLIWGAARYVGCGMAQCVNTRYDYIMVCNYGSPGGPGGPKVTGSNPNPYALPYVAAS